MRSPLPLGVLFGLLLCGPAAGQVKTVSEVRLAPLPVPSAPPSAVSLAAPSLSPSPAAAPSLLQPALVPAPAAAKAQAGALAPAAHAAAAPGASARPADVGVAAAQPAAGAVGEIFRGADAAPVLDRLYEGKAADAAAEAPSAAAPVPSRGGLQPPDRAQRGVAARHATFTTDRGLAGYVAMFDGPTPEGEPGPMARALNALRGRASPVWLDSGGGQGRATQELLERESFEAVKTTLVSYETRAEAGPRRRVLSGRFLEDIPESELGKADLITDLYGPLAYTQRPHELMRKYAASLKDDGTMFLFLGARRDHFGANNPVATADGRVLPLGEWLKTIPGLEVELLKRPVVNLEEVIGEVWVAKVTKKPGAKVVVPDLSVGWFREGKITEGEMVPHMLLVEPRAPAAGPSLAARARAAAARVLAEASGGAEALFDAFRTGTFSSPLLSELEGLRSGDVWDDVGPGAARTAAEFPARPLGFPNPSYMRLGRWLLGLRASRLAGRGFRLAPAADDSSLPPGSARLITDNLGPLASSYEPDRVLQRYMDALAPGGAVLAYLGMEAGGFGEASEVLLHSGRRVTLRSWIESLPGLKTDFHRGHEVRDEPRRWGHYERVMLRIRPAAPGRVVIPRLELLGVGPAGADGIPVPLYREVP